MPANITATGKAGAGISVTAQVFSGVTQYTVTPAGILQMSIAGRYLEIDINAATTFTTTISGSTYTITIS